MEHLEARALSAYEHSSDFFELHIHLNVIFSDDRQVVFVFLLTVALFTEEAAETAALLVSFVEKRH